MYWITGKAGAGKSTLMKYILHHKLTENHLRKWSSDNHLIITGFYFWAAGKSPMQQSQEGLFRTLLRGLFSQKHNLIPQACPKRWEVCRLFGYDPHPWKLSELVETLNIAVKDTTNRFFFLIDGLDEFLGDPGTLLEAIGNVESHPTTKICLSSRPWPIFEDKFRCCSSLMLHHLTSPDIRHFSTTELSHSHGFAELTSKEPDFAQSLVDEIVSKSHGVFLWVRIVIRALLQGLVDGDRIQDLQRKIDQLPEDLEDLFQNIIDSLEPTHREHASQLFQILRVSRHPLSLLSLAFADEEQLDFAIKFKPRVLNASECLGWCTTMRRRINSRSKGLLEIVEADEEASDDDRNQKDNEFPGVESLFIDAFVDVGSFKDPKELECYARKLSKSTVQYMHRTVKDYLDRKDVWDAMVKLTSMSSFSPHSSLCHASLMSLKTSEPNIMASKKKLFWTIVSEAMHHAALYEFTVGKALSKPLDELDKLAKGLPRSPEPGQRLSVLSASGNRAPIHGQRKALHWVALQADGASVDQSFLCLAVRYGLYYYVREKLDSGVHVDQGKGSRSLLDCVVIKPHLLSIMGEQPPKETSRNIELVKLLLERGDDPNRYDYFKWTPWLNLLERIKADYGIRRSSYSRTNPTSSQPEIRKVCYSQRLPCGKLPSQSNVAVDQTSINQSDLKYWMEVVQHFILYGADAWVNLDSATHNAFLSYDMDKTQELGKLLKKQRRTRSQLKRLVNR